MYKHIWTIVCKSSKIDRDTNTVTLIDSLEELQFDVTANQPMPTTEPIGANFSFDVVSLFYRDTKGKKSIIRSVMKVIDPSGKELGRVTNDVPFEANQARVRNAIHSDVIALTNSGVYIFQIYMSDDKDLDKLKQVASLPVDITIRVNGQTA